MRSGRVGWQTILLICVAVVPSERTDVLGGNRTCMHDSRNRDVGSGRCMPTGYAPSPHDSPYDSSPFSVMRSLPVATSKILIFASW